MVQKNDMKVYKMNEKQFTFTRTMIETALKANGWHDLWHPDNWVRNDSENPDYSGINIMDAFWCLLRENNLL